MRTTFYIYRFWGLL